MDATVADSVRAPVIHWPVQCSCGHIFMERFLIPESWPAYVEGYRGFSFCGWCQNRVNHKETIQ